MGILKATSRFLDLVYLKQMAKSKQTKRNKRSLLDEDNLNLFSSLATGNILITYELDLYHSIW